MTMEIAVLHDELSALKARVLALERLAAAPLLKRIEPGTPEYDAATKAVMESNPVAITCCHHWVHMESLQWFDVSGYGTFHRKDIYHCDQCLEMRHTLQSKELHAGDKPKHHIPGWYTGNFPDL